MRQIARQVGDVEAVADIAQEVFLKVLKFRSTFNPAHAFSSWIRGIARNAVFDWLRSQVASRAFTTGSLDGEVIASTDPGAETLIILHSERKRLWKRVRGLSRQQRRVLWFSIVRQLSYDEIAKKLGVSIASVKCLAYRARAVLSKELAPSHVSA